MWRVPAPTATARLARDHAAAVGGPEAAEAVLAGGRQMLAVQPDDAVHVPADVAVGMSDATRGRVLETLVLGDTPVWDLTLSPDASALAAARGDGRVTTTGLG